MCDTHVNMRFFNTEGPVRPKEHYCVPPLDRVDIDAILTLIQRKQYFVLHAPRQTGKTSTLEALARLLNSCRENHCLYINVEAGQAFRENVGEVVRIILGQIVSRARIMLGDNSLHDLRREILEDEAPGNALYELLSRWSARARRPVVLLIDEIDSLVGDSLISVLRQLRSGYNLRPTHFPQSVVLCGVRDVRDYRIYSTSQRAFVPGGSAFNIKAKSLRLDDFDVDEVRSLLVQHEGETGQGFEASAVNRVWELTRGQPWLVNALASEACSAAQPNTAAGPAIDAAAIDASKEKLIAGRVTHLDQLATNLQEPRVRRVIEPVLAGAAFSVGTPEDDLDYAVDIGLVRAEGTVEIANPIYREIIPRQLTYTEERYLAQRAEWYLTQDGSLDVPALLEAFQGFFRQHSEHWIEGFSYKEAGPQLLLQAFLQRVVNSGGRIEREYALGRGRTDLLVEWPERENPSKLHRHVIECKVLRQGSGMESTMRRGVEQTAGYMDRCGAESGHLVIIDRRAGRTWEQRLFRQEQATSGKSITVWGM